MNIDNHPTEKKAMCAFRAGQPREGHALQDEFLRELHESMESEDHCSCTAQCKHHGHCVDCVALHRGHGEHLPECFRDMVNQRIRALSGLTEDTALD